MTTRGIFVLENIRIRQREGSWVPTSDVFGRDSLQQVGYVVGGSDSSNNSVSYYQSISYSSDTRSNVANLPQGRAGVYGVASPSNGYAIGGGPGDNSQPNNTYFSSSNRLNFSTQTNSALPGVNLSESYGRGGSTGSSTAGYVAGGFSGPGGEPTGWSRLDKLTYSTETMQRIPGSNIPGRGYGGATGHSQSATANGDLFGIWIAGNIFPSPSSNLTGTQVMRFQFSTDQWDGTVPSWNLSGPGNRLQKAGMTASGDGAYIVGGSYPANTRVQKISFSDMTNSVVTNTAAPGRTELTATGNPSSGYFAGGATGNNANGTGGSVSSIVEKMDFSTNSISRVPALDLADGLSEVGSMSAAGDNKNLLPITQTFTGKEASFNFGYSMTGRKSPSSGPGPGMEFTYKVDYGTDTSTQVPSAGVSYGYYQAFGAGNSTAAYKLGGKSGSVPGDGAENAEKVVYATDTRAGTPNYGNRRYDSFAVTHGQTTLYGTGGRGQPSNQLHSNTYKMSYSTETWSDIPGANDHLDQSRKQGASLATSTHGYFAGGGNYPSARSDVDKMSFSSETMNKIPSMMLPAGGIARNRGFSRGDAGYSFGGITGPGSYVSRIEKITFSTDTTAAFPSNLPAPMTRPQSMSSDSAGYSVGGNAPSIGYLSSVAKMSFATGTFSASGNLPTMQWQGVGASAGSDNLPFQVPPASTPTASKSPGPAFNGALWMGGYNALTNQYTSAGGKIDFSTDAISNLPTTNLTGNRYNLAATSSPQAGYYGNAQTTEVVKVDYATNSPSTLPSGLSGGNSGPAAPYDARRRGAAFGLKTAGYMMQGSTGYSGFLSNLDKITYSTEVVARLPGSNTPTGSYATVGASNQTAGYQTGGTPGGGTMRKMPFATESWGNAPGASFPEMWDAKSMSNATHGYFIGGSGNANGTRVYKLTFATDSTSQLPTNFPQYSRYGWGTGNSTHGYASGGVNTGSITTRIYKLQYSNDTWSTTPNRIQGGAIQQNAAASARQNGNGNTASNIVPNNF